MNNIINVWKNIILPPLPIRDVYNLSLTSKYFHNIIDKDYLIQFCTLKVIRALKYLLKNRFESIWAQMKEIGAFIFGRFIFLSAHNIISNNILIYCPASVNHNKLQNIFHFYYTKIKIIEGQKVATHKTLLGPVNVKIIKTDIPPYANSDIMKNIVGPNNTQIVDIYGLIMKKSYFDLRQIKYIYSPYQTVYFQNFPKYEKNYYLEYIIILDPNIYSISFKPYKGSFKPSSLLEHFFNDKFYIELGCIYMPATYKGAFKFINRILIKARALFNYKDSTEFILDRDNFWLRCNDKI